MSLQALQRARTLLELVTVRQAVAGGDRYIEASGLNPWCMNEGRAEGYERIGLEWLDAAIKEAETPLPSTTRTPFLMGLRDGLESPHELSMGMTWEHDQNANEQYDQGVNLGQAISKLIPDMDFTARPSGKPKVLTVDELVNQILGMIQSDIP